MRRVLALALWCLAALQGQAAAQDTAPEIAGETQGWSLRESLSPEEEYLLDNPGFDILAVRILEVDERGATNADPPVATVEIEEVLRGPSRRGRVVARWHGPIRYGDVAPEGGMTEAWQGRPLSAPGVGDRLIVFGLGEPGGDFTVQAHAVYRLGEANRQAVLDHAARTRSGPALIALWAGMGAGALGALTLFVVSFFAEGGGAERLRLGVVACAVAALALYVIYESGVSPYAAIRIDLLLLWPAVGLASVLGAVSLVLVLRAKRAR